MRRMNENQSNQHQEFVQTDVYIATPREASGLCWSPRPAGAAQIECEYTTDYEMMNPPFLGLVRKPADSTPSALLVRRGQLDSADKLDF